MRIRVLSYTVALVAANAAAALGQEAAAPAEVSRGVMDIGINLMFYTLIIFGITFWLAKKYFYPTILGMVEAREKALEEAIEGAKRDREAAAKLLAEHTAQLEAGRGEAQKLIADARLAAERVRAGM